MRKKCFLFLENGKGKRGVSAPRGQLGEGRGGYEKEGRKKGKRGWKGLMDTGLRR